MAIAVVILFGSAIAGYTVIAQGCEAGLAKIDGQCLDPFLQPYKQATKQGDEAILLAKNYRSILDLEKAQLSLNDAIRQLKMIPADALVYSETATKLAEYQKNKTAIINSLESEKLALEKLEKAVKTASEAKSQTSGDRTTSELQLAKEKWLTAKATLSAIKSSSLVVAQAEEYRTNYDLEIKDIELRLAAMAKSARSARPRNVYQAPKTTHKPVRKVRKKKYSSPPKKAINADACAIKQTSNCLF